MHLRFFITVTVKFTALHWPCKAPHNLALLVFDVFLLVFSSPATPKITGLLFLSL